jgi:hypothetical protein
MDNPRYSFGHTLNVSIIRPRSGEDWTNPDESPPVGLILCSEHDAAVAHYAVGNLGNQVLAR